MKKDSLKIADSRASVRRRDKNQSCWAQQRATAVIKKTTTHAKTWIKYKSKTNAPLTILVCIKIAKKTS